METFGALSRSFSPFTCTPNFLGLLVQKITLCCRPEAYEPNELKLDLAINNVNPKDWYFVLDEVQFRTGLGLRLAQLDAKLTQFVVQAQP